YAMGGRVAEELVFHDPTTGASNDIDKATGIARKMVTEYGMSDKVGAVKLGTVGQEPFMGRDMGNKREYSEDVAGVIDEEVRSLVETGHDEAWEVLTEYRDVLDDLVLKLLEKETLNQQELAEIFAPVTKRPPRDVWLSSEQRQISTRGPVLTPRELETEEEARQAVLEPAPTQVEAAEHAAEVAGEVPVEGQVALPGGSPVAVVPDDGRPIAPQPRRSITRGTTEVITIKGDVPKAEPEYPDGAGFPHDQVTIDDDDAVPPAGRGAEPIVEDDNDPYRPPR
ncbi:MAG: hypothetical protein FWG25_07165, partial [Promicromonosporaceae bacterium]|nr:hypothetical protein [Promicromonosporaceae bacterium]